MSPDREDSLLNESDERLEPVDPDFVLITDYLTDGLTPEQEAEVERRLVDDAAFFEKVWPVVRIWRLPPRARKHPVRPEDGYRYPWESPPPPRRVREAERFYRSLPAAESAVPVSPAAPPRDLPPAPYEEYEPPRRGRRFLLTLTKRALTVYSIAATLLATVGLAYLGHTYRAVPQDTVVVKLDRAPTTLLAHSTRVETGPAETKEITLRGGSRVVLRPNSRFTYQYLAAPGLRGLSAALDGEAAVELNREDRYLQLVTSAGGMLLTPGTFAVRCEPGCAAMLVTVGVGVAGIRGDSAGSTLSLTKGEKGRKPKHGAPEKVSPGEGWPPIEPPKPLEAPKPLNAQGKRARSVP